MKKIRNIAVIAHVDHGKTTLIDALLKQTHVFRENEEGMQAERIMDSNNLERERGITITAKNCAIEYKGVKINIVDTPGHADFSGEVERTLGMADGALLVIDAQEGPMPQTRFVLRKAFEYGLKLIVVINKIDKPYSRIPYVLDKTENLFLELAKEESQLDYAILYAVGRDGRVFSELPEDINIAGTVEPLLNKIIDFIPGPVPSDDKPFKMLVSSIDYDDHLGRIAIGKIHQGEIKLDQKVVLSSNPNKTFPVQKLFVLKGLKKAEIGEISSGDIAMIAGIPEVKIDDTCTSTSDTEALPSIEIGEPTVHITLGPNTSPFAGTEGEFTTGRQLEERIIKELEKNLSLNMEKLPSGKFRISGRGELHLGVFLENLRREGYEMEVEKPEVVIKEIDGVKKEPVEEVNIIVPQEFVGVINQEMGKRHATLISTDPINDREVEFTYSVPTRAIMGVRNLLLTMTKGTVLFSSQVIGFEPIGKPVPKMRNGVLIASQAGDALSYGLHAAQERGSTFIGPATKVYEGMIVGRNSRDEDISINVCKGKQLTNMRSKSSDGVIQLAPPTELGLDRSLGFLEDDELLEITPLNLRLRKKHLTDIERRRNKRKAA